MAYDLGVATSQAKLVAFNAAAGNTDAATSLTAAQVTGENDAQTQNATKFFLQSFNGAAPPDGYSAAPIPVNTPITDPRVIAALTYETNGEQNPQTVYPVASGFPFAAAIAAAAALGALWWANEKGYLS